ncbi:FAD-dependent oxidoreductase [Nocardia brasiliensis]|uniref:FAD-dependent oxidoreductase n=1 Tax=Nocardia brasiliensis TaxID=37326 RepID=UPI003D8F6EDB
MRVSSKQAKVVVLGGGYAGVAAATRLARANTAVTLVNPRAEFVERIRLHQYVAGNHAAVSPMRNHLPETVEFRHDTAGVIDAQARRVELSARPVCSSSRTPGWSRSSPTNSSSTTAVTSAANSPW